MKSYLAFTQKEFMESLRTYKFLIILMVFLLLGMLGPLTAKLTPLLLEKLMAEGTGAMQIILGDPTALDSWAQFFKNIPTGLFVISILFSGMMANEFSRGTLVNIMTKGLRRSTIILSKFTVASIIWTVSYFVCFVLSYFYTAYFWREDGISNLLISIFFVWLFGILLIAVILLGGVISKTSYGCLLLTGSFIVILSLLNIVPKFQPYNPLALLSKGMLLLTGNTTPKDLIASAIISIAIIVGSIFTAIGFFNKKEI